MTATSMRHRLATLIASAATLTAATLGTVTLAVPAAHADTQICDKFGSTTVSGGQYIVQNNEWGDTIQQCINATNDGFSITAGNHNVATNGAPAAYPSIYAGCHYGNCSANSGLPLQVSHFGNVRSSVNFTTAGGQWDSSYDIWFDPTAHPAGQNTGAELMIWANHAGAPRPVGSVIGQVNLEGGTWDVWEGNIGWNVISYVRTAGTNAMNNFSINAFTRDSVSRGYINSAWYLTSVQFGFEPWQGGVGLGVNSFSFTTNGSGSTGGGGGGSGARSLVEQQSGRCLDISGGRTADGTKAQLWDCLGNAAQGWTYTGGALVNQGSNKCLDVSGGRTANGTIVQLWTCLGNTAQQWVFQSNGTLLNPNSGKCLDATAWGTGNGTQLEIWQCGTGNPPQSNQVFTWR